MTAQSNRDERLLDEALAWHWALEGDDADWDAYTLWLEADPHHRAAFDEIALTDAAVDRNRDTLATLLSSDTAAPATRYRFRRPAAIGAVAASLALAVGVPVYLRQDPVATYETGRSEGRTLALANGTQVSLAPSSRMTVTGKDAGRIELARGEAYFDVRHDPARTLTVTAGDYKVTDIGTRFSVNLSDGAFRIGVSEGNVAVSAPGSDQKVQVGAGHQLVASGGNARLSQVPAAEVGSWRKGRLVYTDAPLSLVAADISRYSGKAIIVDPSLGNSHFSGVLVIGDGSKLLENLAGLMAVRVRDEGRRVRISAGDPR